MTTKQRAALRSMGAVMEPVLHIGKEGITPTVIKQCWDALEARELIKVQVQRNAPYGQTREACDELCEKVHAEPVQVIGNRFVIYREAREDSRIHLDELG
ncbi:MAG: YhbY family RNA-binding protein [Clostridia bacterium]|nr:YhbY family RNA-binding protein [Clostridiales bacterium]MDO4386771.1 YhbY family RNA-binding protein [Clostridia bacterium]MDO4828772.1 YhbY family RNA-binding protein [Clostridia bacterium]MDY2770440.1 YhbY family RNA-binding protein [Eubacteriales bacterium]